MGFRFRPRWWAFLLALAACAAAVSLGNWQAHRAADKRDLAARFGQAGRAAAVAISGSPAAPEALVFRRLSARGEFVPKFTVLIDNKVYKGRAGYFVVTPLHLSGSALHVLVNRGWVPGGARREDIPAVRTPEGEVVVEGLGLARAQRVLAAGERAPGARVWQNFTNEEFARWSGLALQPVFLEQHSAIDDDLVRDWPSPDFGIEMHESYAMQWYLIAALSAVLFLSLSLERNGSASD